MPIDENTEKRAMLALRRIVKNNGIVSITVGSRTRTPQTVRFRHGELPISAGAVRLAEMTGAPLIPVFSVRTGKSLYEVHVEAPINVDDNDVDTTLRYYADALMKIIDQYPYQARGLLKFSARGPDDG